MIYPSHRSSQHPKFQYIVVYPFFKFKLASHDRPGDLT
ncbi:hypothetical protein PBPMD00_6 [Pinkberry virus LS07-2018-MD00]|nr:hypothetical protein PBPMD00_6 [Pinkberry virus LS07-2018-MD00]